jgi:fatty acid desaturase
MATGVHKSHRQKESRTMLWTIAVILFVLWALGIATAYTLSGFIHILLLLAVVCVLIRVIQGRSPVL